MIPRSRIRIPIWAALTIVGAAYVLRSTVIRGGDFSVNSGDAIAAAVVLIAVAAVSFARKQYASGNGDDGPYQEGDDEHHSPGDSR